MLEAAFFYAFTALMLGAAASVALNRHPIYSVLSLLAVMFCLAGLFIMLGAYFVAALQLLLYAGAVLVLFLFVIMLLNLAPEELQRRRAAIFGAAGGLAALAIVLLLWRAVRSVAPEMDAAGPAAEGTVESIGRLLFTTYLLPFELTSFLILAAIVGAVALAKHERPTP